jgi:prepilin-type N-terminal cleavage/methylation domain-containing protein
MPKRGFTLIELLVVIAIIGILSATVLVSLNTTRLKARDARRLSDMQQIQTALELYYFDNGGNYPAPESGNGSWEESQEDNGDFLGALVSGGYLPAPVVDPINSSLNRYAYYLYSAGSSGCDSARGQYYVLGVRYMETHGRPFPGSPGWDCPSRDWQSEFDWVTGNFEN